VDLATLDSARRRICSNEKTVVVEAAAGCGKTFEAVTAVETLGRRMESGRELLLLTHTNAARRVFEERIRVSGASATIETLDSLALQIVQRYAPHLGLAQPVVPASFGTGPSFEHIRRLAADLLIAAPAVAQGRAWRHPVILVDEHQDSSVHQHAIVEAIASSGTARVRYFGDRLQSIYAFAGGGNSWDRLCHEHDPVTLEFGHRWHNNAELREWLLHARHALLAGRPIDLRDRPDCVRVQLWSGPAPSPTTKGHCPEVLTALRGLNLPSDSAILVCDGAHGRGLVERLGGRHAKFYEGADVTEPLVWLERAIAAGGDAPRLARLLAELLHAWGPGIPQSKVDELAAVCTRNGIDAGKRKNILPLIDLCRPLYTDPTPATWLNAFAAAVNARDALGWRPLRRDATWLLATTSAEVEDLRESLMLAARRRSRLGRLPARAVMTVHRAKGAEFDTVVLPYVTGADFGDSQDDAKKLYVAITRPHSRLHLFISRDNPSPRFRL
jgi:hypothetical protein